jgi:glucose/arabinose dehydrogenase
VLTKIRVASNLTLPTFATAPPGDVDRLFILERSGTIRLVKAGVQLQTAVLDLTAETRSPDNGGANEQGLLGLAFHPGYAANGWLFIYRTNLAGDNVVERYTRSAGNPDTFDAATRQLVMTLAHPSETGHNGGMLAFGPVDHKLYIGVGDGADPTGCVAQSLTSNWGKILRIDVDTLPYTIPPDNPYVGPDGANDEIWMSGLRNPWRYSFDRSNGDLYIGDVGETEAEEVDWRPASTTGRENFGWPNYEGNACANPCAGTTCVLSHYVAPALVYDHSAGCAIVGGYAYRGCRMPDLAGTYFYSDFCTSWQRTLRIVGGLPTDVRDRTSEIGASPNATAFGEDARGEIYYVKSYPGEVFKIVPVLPSFEVSGLGAHPFRLRDPYWTWENLYAASSHPIASYRVYRSSGNGGGVFDCVFATAVTYWAGGDPTSPAPGQLFTYVVVAVNASGQMTSPGTRTSGAPRTLSAVACP